MVDRSEIVPGAVVTVRGVVERIQGHGVVLMSDDPRVAGPWVADGNILSVEPRPLAVGDRVRLKKDGDALGRVLLVHSVGNKHRVILEWSTGPLSNPIDPADLTRLPDDPAPAEKAMRFKVGDRVDDRDVGRGTVVAVRPTAPSFKVEFEGGFRAWCFDADLSPAPAEERAP